ncbi:g7029 [Coccomyxa viridis]|uniref:G7029 protein n=1 Tax=Coccomyxa viridis TaxID=1274662 RepID=A0ABP1G0T8_9CHLO
MEAALDEEREVDSQTFLVDIFGLQAASGGAEVATTMLHIHGDGSSAIGAAICQYVEKHQPAALAMMKQNKSGFTRAFVGSVTRYCAVHSRMPVIIIPE